MSAGEVKACINAPNGCKAILYKKEGKYYDNSTKQQHYCQFWPEKIGQQKTPSNNKWYGSTTTSASYDKKPHQQQANSQDQRMVELLEINNKLLLAILTELKQLQLMPRMADDIDKIKLYTRKATITLEQEMDYHPVQKPNALDDALSDDEDPEDDDEVLTE